LPLLVGSQVSSSWRSIKKRLVYFPRQKNMDVDELIGYLQRIDPAPQADNFPLHAAIHSGKVDEVERVYKQVPGIIILDSVLFTYKYL
jgi:hypothetical protein